MALGMSALIIVVGALLVLNRDQLFRAMSVFGAPVTGLYVVEFLRKGIINTGNKYFTAATGTTSMRRHLVLPLLGVISLTVIGIFTLNDLPEVVGERAWAIDWIFVLLVAMGCMATVMAKSRLTVVVVVSIAGFGKFAVKDRPERQGRNPSTGEAMTIAASKKVSFTPAKGLKDKL